MVTCACRKGKGSARPAGWPERPRILTISDKTAGSSRPFCNSVHKRDENRSERRRLSAVEAARTPASGKSGGDTRRECPAEPARAGPGMPKGRRCSAVPEEREPKRSFRRRQIDAHPKGGNNPECRRVVPAGGWPKMVFGRFRDDRNAGFQ